MNSPNPVIDANLAIALDALPDAHSVTRAAARLHASPAAATSSASSPPHFGAAPSPPTDDATALGLRLLDIPLPLPPLTISMAGHPRNTADGAHHWLRTAIRRTVRTPRSPTTSSD
ncbi:hypothetical protein ACLMAJ_23210 [Nocardia sp. KC 131]|uniref:hypothetical protein n=1 Tax=Nocardia arseniciresistens TaxID=3392119 RepID=UPI00398E3159